MFFPNYKYSLIILFGGIVAVIILVFFYSISLFWILIPLVIFFGLLIFGTFNICSNFYTPIVCRIDTNDGIFLTFDDGPHPVFTEKILDILKKHQAQASFFCVGKNFSGNEKILKRIENEEHTIGNHTLNHSPFFAFFAEKSVLEEICLTNEKITEITGTTNILFRPPAGVLNPRIVREIRKLNMKIIGWNVRSLDTVLSPEKVLARLTNVKAGDIILFHDNRENTPEILDQFLGSIKSKKLKCYTLARIKG